MQTCVTLQSPQLHLPHMPPSMLILSGTKTVVAAAGAAAASMTAASTVVMPKPMAAVAELRWLCCAELSHSSQSQSLWMGYFRGESAQYERQYAAYQYNKV